MAKYTIDLINEELKDSGWKCISPAEAYKNLDSQLTFTCEEGHPVVSSWKKIRQRRFCPACQANEYKEQPTEIVPKQKGIKRTLALDQATHITGWSIFDGTNLIRYGTFKTNQSDEIDRSITMKNWMLSMINSWQPDLVAIEGIQLQEESEGQRISVTVFETLARLQGILMATCVENKMKYLLCPTNTWRKHCQVKGRHRSDKKRSMQFLAKKWYDITVSDDEADAIGIGKYAADISNIEVVNWE